MSEKAKQIGKKFRMINANYLGIIFSYLNRSHTSP